MYFMAQNKRKDEIRKKEREQKAQLCKINMSSSPTYIGTILNEQHQREKDAKSKERAQPAENAKFDLAKSLYGTSSSVRERERKNEVVCSETTG